MPHVRRLVRAAVAAMVGVAAASCGGAPPAGAPGTTTTSASSATTASGPIPSGPTTTTRPATSVTASSTTERSAWPTSSYPVETETRPERLAMDVMTWVYEPYRRWAFTGSRVPVVGDCLLGPCDFPIDDLVDRDLLARLRGEATSAYDPFLCRAEPVEVLVDNGVADLRAPVAVVSLSGDASEVNGGTNRVTMVIARGSGRLVDLVCSANPLPPDGRSPLPVAAGTRHTVAEGLELLWEIYNWVPASEPPYVPRPCDGLPWRWCGGRGGAGVLSPAMIERQAANEGSSVVTCCQNSSPTEARGAVTLVGNQLTVEMRTHWGLPIVATVDLDSLLLTDVVCWSR